MIYCFDSQLPWDYSKKEMEITNLMDICVLYDRKTKSIVDLNNNEVDITGKKVLIRTGVEQAHELIDEVTRHGGIPIINKEDIYKIEEWPRHFKTERKIQIFTGHDLTLPEVIEHIENTFGDCIFFKTLHKNFNEIIPVSLFKDKECAFYKALNKHLDEEFFVSDVIDILEDEHGKKEYRCFVVNGEIYNISRMTTEGLHSIDESVLRRLEEIVASLKGKFPDSYVVDVFEYMVDGEVHIDVVEFNPIYSSGPYLYNSCIIKSNDLLHNDAYDVSKEFMDHMAECSVDGEYVNDRPNLYRNPNSFAKDLHDICIFGGPGGWSSDTHITVEDFKRHEAKINASHAEVVTDADLFRRSDEEKYKEYTDLGMDEETAKQLLQLLNKQKGQ